MAGEVVLIVEDNPNNMKLARDVLEYWGFHTLEAVTAAAGIRMAASGTPDLVLMDIQLPDMDGLAALERLRADPATSGLRVVALTAFAMREERERLLAAGFDGYISKPIDIKAFPGQVRDYCNQAAREGVNPS
jgi:two-component system cell cycle response regulator DivK